MPSTLLPIFLGALISGCAVDQLSLKEEVTYIAEWIGDEPVIGRRPVSVTFSDGRAYGNTGCNHWFAGYQLEGQQLRFEQAGTTRQQCAEPISDQERRFLDILEAVERWDVSDIDQLRLWPGEGSPLRFWPAPD
ncbi:META domain-containing protein [Stutzerimonas tarimensis]|uniref:META domain-containing protein n=1 Tax=Stutzerimonas tarimensis TaxID=1507735 RepID=A0ABV7SZH5_9GAMM